MTPDRIGLPARPSTGSLGAAIEDDRSIVTRHILIIVVMVLLISVLHLFTNASYQSIPLHLLYRRMYFIPIIYAAFVFGRRGGVLTALACSVLFSVHAGLSLNRVFGMGFDNALEIASYLIAGLLFGSIRDLEESKTRDLRQVSRPTRGGVSQARGAGHPADQRAGLHLIDPALDHLRRSDRRTGRLGCHGEPCCRAHAGHVRVRDGAQADTDALPRRRGHLIRRHQGARGSTAARAARYDARDSGRS